MNMIRDRGRVDDGQTSNVVESNTCKMKRALNASGTLWGKEAIAYSKANTKLSCDSESRCKLRIPDIDISVFANNECRIINRASSINVGIQGEKEANEASSDWWLMYLAPRNA